MKWRKKIKLSVIIPVYNQEELVVRALESIPNRADLEVIVVDDGSTDNTVKAVNNFFDRPELKFAITTVIMNHENRGVGYSVNKGLDEAVGDYVVLLGSDDYFYTVNFNSLIKNQLDGSDLVYFDLETNDGTVMSVTPETKHDLVGSVKCMKRSFIKDTRCPIVRRAEDFSFTKQLYAKNPTENFTNIIAKHYNYPRKGSLSINASNYPYGLSIIIPAYNNEPSLERLLTELLYQKTNYYPETEIIVINDGSEDSYSSIEQMKGIVYKKQENKGAAAARNAGLELATRQYVTFIDSDDFVTPNYLHTIYSHFQSEKPVYRLNWQITTDGDLGYYTILTPEDSKQKIITNARGVMMYVYQHNLIDDIYFNENYNVGEDEEWLERVLPTDMDSYELIDFPIYFYETANETSLTHRYNRGEINKLKEE